MTDQPKVVRSNQSLNTHYTQLTKDDVICTRIKFHQGQEGILTDLVERGIKLIPSGTSQLLSKSKVLQAQLLGNYMVNNSIAVFNNHDLLRVTSEYPQQKIEKVVLKLDRKDGGLGIHLFENIESLYNHTASGSYPFPFVIQPYVADSRDIRVIVLGDYIEAYERANPNNFRNNLHCGGTSTPYVLSDKQVRFCREVMERGTFPYAHLDLILLPDNSYKLMEINLRGGLRGATINGRDYEKRTGAIHEELLREFLAAKVK